MHVYMEPAIDRWRLAEPADTDRIALIALTNRNAGRIGSESLDARRPVIATGHQPWLWHPGILAKDMAASLTARRFDAQPLHVVVDQDVAETVSLEVPVHIRDALRIEQIVLAALWPSVATCSQPPAEAGLIVQVLESVADELGDDVAVDLEPLRRALCDLPDCGTLAEQITVVLGRLRRPYVPTMPVIFASQLQALPAFSQLISRMLAEAPRCVACYNRAVARWPLARVAPLRVERNRVELPLWFVAWQQPRRRVVANLAGTTAVLTLDNGHPIDVNESCDGPSLVPRALPMTAFLRWACCDLFIHGKGGAVYDRITEQWWADWLGWRLAPRVTVSADLYLSLDSPIAECAEYERAVWWRHHVQHNVDRVLKLTGWRVQQKRYLIEHMADDRDRARRAAAFQEIHRINQELGAVHPQVLRDADHSERRARVGLANLHIARKRDWCFALYQTQQLQRLASALASPKLDEDG